MRSGTAPPHIIESGIATEALLAQIAVAKYADGLPLYRQEAIYARDKTELSRSLMAQWMGKVGFELQPLADYVLERIKQGERVFADETTLPTLAPGTGKTQKAWLWAYARDDTPFGGTSPPMVAYRFEDSRQRRLRGAGKKIKGKKRHILVDTQGLLMHAIVHAADIQDRDGGAFVMATMFGMYPFLMKLYADGGYQGPLFRRASRPSASR